MVQLTTISSSFSFTVTDKGLGGEKPGWYAALYNQTVLWRKSNAVADWCTDFVQRHAPLNRSRHSWVPTDNFKQCPTQAYLVCCATVPADPLGTTATLVLQCQPLRYMSHREHQ